MSGTQNPITDQEGLGPAGNGKDLGFLCHPTLVTDPENRAVIGATGMHIWAREEQKEAEAGKQGHSGRKPLEEKESYRWAERAVAARERLSGVPVVSETLFSNRKNDLSGLINRRVVVLDEQQSSINENMPFRCLSHIASIFENTVADKSAVYRQTLVKLPRPVFIVLYTGTAPYPDRTTLKLSDAFEKVEGNDSVNLELTVEVININKGRNEEIVNRCGPLRGYVEFVDTVRANQARLKAGNPGTGREAVLEKAIALAVSYCKEHNILKDFFTGSKTTRNCGFPVGKAYKRCMK
jgi:hypothetical protein